MKLFAIEAYGGKQTTDGAIAHFTVRAECAANAIEIVRASDLGQRYHRFDVIDETVEKEAADAGILTQSEGRYVKPI